MINYFSLIIITLFTFFSLLYANTIEPTLSSDEKTSSENTFIIPSNYIQGTFFNDTHIYYIAEDTTIKTETTGPLISLVLFDRNGDPFQNLMTKSNDSSDYTVSIHSISMKDLNNDNFNDLIVNLSESYAGISNINSYFFINTQDQFKALELTFKKDAYTFISPTTIQVKEPLYSFGTPYETDQTDSQNSMYNPIWVNHYQFDDQEIQLANTNHLNYYEKILVESKQNLEETLKAISSYKMDTKSPDLNQLQLNEYFHEVSTQKLIIQRCETIIYLL